MSTQSPQSMHFEAEATLDARPETVWDILTDYREGHPNITPPQAFSDFQVESGGKGAGTVMRFTFRIAGTKRHMRQIVSAPEPGRVLVESDIDGPTRTAFTLTPVDGGRQTRVLITTDQAASRGVAGAIERLLSPLVAPTMRRLYWEELSRLEALARRWPQVASPSAQ
ncbi:MAG TPA: SRPBCC family protein [Ktedonobacterales bacterium]|nr:SRPBCC family protein [Ktedonobacterales bacterium]